MTVVCCFCVSLSASRNTKSLLFSIVVLLSAAVSLSQETSLVDTSKSESCISDENTCTCSQKKFTGVCTRPQSGGECIQAACRPTFACDCLGFEICSISKCGKWVATGDAVPSTRSPFQCHLLPDSNECRTSIDVMATVESSNAAKDSVNDNVDDLLQNKGVVSESIARSVQHYSEALNAVKLVEALESQVSPSDLNAIRSELDKCENALHVSQEKMAMVFQISGSIYDAMRNTKSFRGMAMEEHEGIKGIEKEIERAEESARSEGSECGDYCDLLIDSLTLRRAALASAARQSAIWAKSARESQNEVWQSTEQIQKSENVSKTSRDRCMDLSSRILAQIPKPIS